MKNFKKILAVLCVLTLLVTGCVIATFAAEEYTGTVEDLTSLVEAAEAASSAADKLSAVEAVKAYLDATPVDPATEGYDDLIHRTNVCALACFNGFVESASKDSATLASASADLDNADKALTIFELPENLEGYSDSFDEYDAAVLKCADLLIKNIDANITTTLKTATNRVAINTYNGFVKTHALKLLDPAVAYAELNAALEVLVAEHDKAVEILLAEIDSKNAISDYDLPMYDNYDFEMLNPGTLTGTACGPFSIQNNGFATHPFKVEAEANGNKYFSHYYELPAGNSFHYINLGQKSGGSFMYEDDNGYVFSFDFTTFTQLPSKGIDIEAGGINTPDMGRIFPPYFLTIDGSGSLIGGTHGSNSGTTTMLEKAVVPGEWINITITFDPEAFVYTTYVDGEKIGSYCARYNGNKFEYDEGGAHIRFSGKDDNGSFAIDNFVFYSGTNYRNVSKFDEMNDDEKFIYYAEYFSDEDRDINGKNVAYTRAGELISKYWTWTDKENNIGEYTEYANGNPAIKSAVDQFLSFDFEELLGFVKKANLEEYISMIVALDNIERSTTVSDRTLQAGKISAFAVDYADYINKEIDEDGNGKADYYQYNEVYSRVLQEMIYDENAKIFIRHMYRFGLVTTLSALERYYSKARALIDEGGIDLSIINGTADISDKEKANFKELFEAYETFVMAADHIVEVTKMENSNRILICMGMISEYDTEEEWLANYDFVYKYLSIVKPVVLEKEADGSLKYDKNYEGVEEAVEFFNVAYDYCYNVLQTTHVEYLNGILESIASNDAYIEKMGMVSMMDRYLADNDINFADPRIIEIRNNLETCRAELQLREEDYAKILYQNGVYFVNCVEKLRTSETYAEQKKYFVEATELYYNMDITVEGAARAASIYEEIAIEIAIIEEASVKFLEAVAIYQACENNDDRYAALVECYYYAGDVEMSFEGAAEAMAFYEAEYAAYMSYAEATNAEIVATGNAVGSLRTTCGISTVIAIIIKKIFEV